MGRAVRGGVIGPDVRGGARKERVAVQLLLLALCTLLSSADGNHHEATHEATSSPNTAHGNHHEATSSPNTDDAHSTPTTLTRPPPTSGGADRGVTVSGPAEEAARLMAEAEDLPRAEDRTTEVQGEPQKHDTSLAHSTSYYQESPATGGDETAADNQRAAAPPEDVSAAETMSVEDGNKDGEHREGFVIEQEDARHGLVEYTAPEDQALDHLISMASKGLRVIASGAVVGFHRTREVVMRTARKLSSKQFVDTFNGWLALNETARKESMTAAHKAILSVHQTTAVVLARTPDYLDRSRQMLDQACHSLVL